MWNAWHNQSTNFETLAAALSYLKLCLLGAVQDTLRFYEKQMVELPEPGTGSPDEPVAREEDDGRDLWEVIESFLPTEREKRAAYLLFHCNLKAREVMQHCPGEFKHVSEVHRLRRNIFDRLMRNADQLRWRLSDGEEKE
jgi:hypothetical protein